MPIEQLIAEANKRGLRINNLYEIGNGRWRANLTDDEKFYNFGEGETAAEALRDALRQAEQEGFKSKAEPAPKRRVVIIRRKR